MAPRKRKPPGPKPTVKRPKEYYQYRYSVVQRALSAEYKRSGSTLPYALWCASEDAVRVRENTSAECDRLHDTEYGRSAPGNLTESSTANPASESATRKRGVSNSENNDPNLDNPSASKLPRSDTNSETMPADERMDTTQYGDPPTGGSGQQPRTSRGGGPSAVPLNNSHGSQQWTASFSKSRIWYSYGYSQVTSYLDTKQSLLGTVTPLSFIPVDYLPFYLDSAEYATVPPNTWVKRVTCQVRVLGVRSGFDIGATVTGVATSEYCPILLTAIGLNNNVHIMNKKIKSESTAPMIPTGLEDISLTDYMDKWYVDPASGVTCVPRSNSVYAVPYRNTSMAKPDWDDATKKDVLLHDAGNFRLDKFVKSHLLHSTVGETVVDYEYEPHMGVIKEPDPLCIPYHRASDGLMMNAMNIVDATCDVSTKEYKLTQKEPLVKHHMAKSKFFYHSQIEKYGIFAPRYGALNPRQNVQPQVHIGLSAIPQLNPATEHKNFVNCCVYYAVDCSIELESRRTTEWTGKPTQPETDALFSSHANYYYEQPHSVFGMWDGDGGSIKVTTNKKSSSTSARLEKKLAERTKEAELIREFEVL
ncbi:putative structural protein [Diaphorina citri densovirus]|uniref:Putative structural protein n=1 Tax=Diaphorina citri densovirus TaxID=1776153 RepID=A0A0U3SRZ6_9VIRU|nr:putative structural protein [Diaphorina citri densovirus]ALV85427.1 structural protein 1 [Diaphorina citri densovirus]ANH56806.1 putative structural protein [Diaphorina citri densovirus]